ncbi:S8 family serine peptidase [Solirubrobacter phytolaccae]|uniref:S8 family serine peptidase n=1 Tax=Solirubrobacter phytolaccae TaxID=1404360 RepID=A0A9X3NCB8_9ACTN|nr:S8 family serine peptidase [Solirubrobacter phytolaccae]MDA0182235.1 S8 family serine peptidase [Solirubrobacter phytolaccae]
MSRLPDGAYRIRGTTDASLGDLQGLAFIDSAAAVQPFEKLDATLAPAARQVLRTATSAAATSPPVSLLVTVDANYQPEATQEAAASIGEVTAHSARRMVVQTTADRIADVAALDGVLNVELEPDIRTQNNVARTLTGVEPVATTLALDGTGEIVGVADSGLDTGEPGTIMPDFNGRVLNVRATVAKAAAFGVADGADLNNHGTHVCGSIAGDGANSNGTIRGMAPAARLTVLSMGPDSGPGLVVPLDLGVGVFDDAYTDGARIHSDSWGDSINLGRYTALSQDVDEFVWDHRDLLVIISAGNAGDSASTVTPPGTAKNCLTVGASESVRPLPAIITIDPNLQDVDGNPATPPTNFPLQWAGFGLQADNADDIADFSSRGPVNDNGDSRIKPDIVAPGTFILSCRSTVSIADVGPDGLPPEAIGGLYPDDADGLFDHTEAVGRGLPGGRFFGTWNQNTPGPPAGAGPLATDNYVYESGTSMATPITSGAVAVLRQYLRERRGIENPSAALMKAFIINAAKVPPAMSTAPSNAHGFGWLNLQAVLTPAPTGQQAYSDDVDLAVATGDVREFSVQVADPLQPLRVTLTWSDFPGKGLQNRLYLRVLPPGGTPAIDGDVTAFPNPRNNVQRVHVPAPVPGVYTIQVHGVNVAFGIPEHAPALRQDFALAVINGVGFSPRPVDVAQVIDHSGSMGFYSFMVPARERAKQLVDVLRINDRTGVVQFDHTAATVSPVATVTSLAGQVATKTAIDTINPAGATSIGAGLQQGVQDLAAGGDPSHPQAIVLLSDGHENTPPWVGGGLTNSPPAWYTGPDFTDALPGVPATTKIYTVSLGVASDEVLLQAIAAARGGVFQAIHSAAEIGKLHEIYVHLQALVGGEEVIAAGSGSVSGIGPIGQPGINLAVLPRTNGNAAPELAHLVTADPALAEAMLAAKTPFEAVHPIPVDDTVTSVVFLVSWHDTAHPVAMRLVSPSLNVITPSTVLHQSIAGSSYSMIRIERPEPGVWELRVTADKTDRPGTHLYTFGVTADSPLGLRLVPPRRITAGKQQTLNARLVGNGLAKTLDLTGRALVPRTSVDALLKKHAAALKALKTRLKPDSEDVSVALSRLPILDLNLVAQGKPSLFQSSVRNLVVAPGRTTRKLTVPTPTSGITGVDATLNGTTKGGFEFIRVRRLDLRT